MPMKKNKLTWFIITIFIILSALGIYFIVALRIKSPTEELPGPLEHPVIKVEANDPIRKGILAEKDGMAYDIEGHFTEKLKKENELLVGNFIIQGDPRNTEIKTYIGNLREETLLGIYEESFEGASTWTFKASSQVAEEIKEGETVIIKFEIIDESGAGRDYIERTEKIMDTIIRDFQSGEYVYDIPVDLLILSGRIGVIR
jgi:hypothetical protein